MERAFERNHANGLNFITIQNISSYILIFHTKIKKEAFGASLYRNTLSIKNDRSYRIN